MNDIKILKTEIKNFKNLSHKIIDINGKSITSENFKKYWFMRNLDRLSNKNVFRKYGFWSVDFYGKAIRIPTNVLNIADKLFTDFIGYRGLLNANAWRHAYNESEINNQGLTPADENWMDVNQRYSEIKAQPENYSLDSKSIDAKSHDEAMALAFKAPLSGASKKLISFLDSIPGLRWIVPFKKTPWNVAKQVPLRTPILRRATQEWQESEGADRDMMDAKMATGMLVASLAASLIYFTDPEDEDTGVKLPWITGSGPTNKHQAEVWKRMGIKPYSIRGLTGDMRKYVDIRRAQPISTPFMLVADMADTFERVAKLYDDNPPEDVNKQMAVVALSVVVAIGQSMSDQVFLDDIHRFMDMTSYALSTDSPDLQSMSNDARARWLNNLYSKLVPYSANLRAMAKAEDPYMLEARSAIENLRKGLPGFIEDNISGLKGDDYPQRNFWGEPVEYYDSAAARYFSPFYSTKIDIDPVDVQIYNLLRAGEKVRGAMPSHKITIDNVPIHLNTEDYDLYIRFINGMPGEGEGPSLLKKDIATMITRTAYREADNKVRAKMISEKIGKAEDRAKKLLLQVSPTFVDKINIEKVIRKNELKTQRNQRR